jgi:hypothetical protein
MEEKIIWKRLIYQGNDYGDYYLISNTGEIKGVKTNKIRRKNILHTGYYFVSGSLGSRENKITFKIHKAVAETFIDNPNKLPMVNHKDGNKLNNHVENLEWCDNITNINHAYDNDLCSSNKKIICLNTKHVFRSIRHACSWCGLSENSGSLKEYLYKINNRNYAGVHPETGEKLQWMFYKDYLKLHHDK